MAIRAVGSSSTYMNAPAINRNNNTSSTFKCGTKFDKGVLAGNWNSANNSQIFIDGEIQSLANGNSLNESAIQRVGIIAQYNWGWTFDDFYVDAVVLYNTQLDALQHLELAIAMEKL